MNTKSINNLVNKAMEEMDLPGAAIAVVQGDETYVQGFGKRQNGKPETVDADTVFAIGSTSKAFTSAAAGILVGEGKISWDDPVIKYLPEFTVNEDWVTKNVSIRDLLCHRLGLERAQRLYYQGCYSQDELVLRMRFLHPNAPFRSQFQYANQNFGTVGNVIKAVSGKSWDDFVTENIFQPLGMTRTFPGYDRIPDFENFSQPHAVMDLEVPAGVRFLGTPSLAANIKLSHEPSGSIHTTAADLAKWLKALLSDGAPLMSHSVFSEITSPQMIMQNLAESELAPLFLLQPGTHFWTYGLGWWVMDYRGEKVVMHGGQMPGYNSVVAFYPERKIGFAFMVNTHQTLSHAAMFYALSDLLLNLSGRDWVMEFKNLALRYIDEGQKQVKGLYQTRNSKLPPGNSLSSFAAAYENSIYGKVIVDVSGDSLNLVYGNINARLEHWEGNTFLAHWNLSCFLDDSFVSFEPNGSSLTIVNDHAEYKRI